MLVIYTDRSFQQTLRLKRSTAYFCGNFNNVNEQLLQKKKYLHHAVTTIIEL